MEFTDGAALLWGSKSGFGIPFIPVSSLNAISTLGHLAQRLSSYFSG